MKAKIPTKLWGQMTNDKNISQQDKVISFNSKWGAKREKPRPTGPRIHENQPSLIRRQGESSAPMDRKLGDK